MNRRILVAGLPGAAVLPLAARFAPNRAFAQPASPNAPKTPIEADEYKRLTLMAGTLAKQTSELALQKVTHPKVKQFAGFEVAEQTAMAQVPTNQPPAPLGDKHAAALKVLQDASGAEFDRVYVKAQIEGHSELLTIQDAFTSGKGQDTASLPHPRTPPGWPNATEGACLNMPPRVGLPLPANSSSLGEEIEQGSYTGR